MEMIYLLENRHDLSTTLPPPQLGSIASILHRDLFSLFIYSQSIFHMAKGYALYILHIYSQRYGNCAGGSSVGWYTGSGGGGLRNIVEVDGWDHTLGRFSVRRGVATDRP